MEAKKKSQNIIQWKLKCFELCYLCNRDSKAFDGNGHWTSNIASGNWTRVKLFHMENEWHLRIELSNWLWGGRFGSYFDVDFFFVRPNERDKTKKKTNFTGAFNSFVFWIKRYCLALNRCVVFCSYNTGFFLTFYVIFHSFDNRVVTWKWWRAMWHMLSESFQSPCRPIQFEIQVSILSVDLVGFGPLNKV